MASPRTRFSLFSLMVLVAFVAIGAAALLQPSEAWASILYTLTLAAVCWATATAFLPGRWRAFSTGCEIFGWIHLGLLIGTPLGGSASCRGRGHSTRTAWGSPTT